MSSYLCNKRISQLKIEWSFSCLTLWSLRVTTKLSLQLSRTAWTYTNKLPNKKPSMLSMPKISETWGHRVLTIPHWILLQKVPDIKSTIKSSESTKNFSSNSLNFSLIQISKTKKHSKFKIALNLSIGEKRFLFYSQTLKRIIN